MADFSLFQNVPGLLTPEQQGNVNSQAMMSAAAALLRASGPSPYKNTTLSGLGEGLQGFLTGHQQGTDEALKQQLTRGQIGMMQMTMGEKLAVAKALGIDPSALFGGGAGVAPGGAPMLPTGGGAPAGGGAPGGPPIAPTARIAPALPMATGARPSPAPPAPTGPLAGGPPMQNNNPLTNATGYSIDKGDGGPPVTGTFGGPAPGGGPAAGPAPAPVAPPPAGIDPMAGLTPQQRILAGFGPKPIADLITKNAALTDKQKDARTPGPIADLAGQEEAAKEGATADTKYFDSVYRGLTGSATIAAQQKQNIATLRQIAASPDFKPGFGSETALGMQRLLAAYGINPKGAAPREVFNQLAARVLADQFSGLKSMSSETGEQGGRVFKPMLDLEEKANITADDSLEGVKSKLNLLDNAGNLMMHYGDMADDYKQKHGRLDAGFNKQMRSEIAASRIGDIGLTPVAAPPMEGAKQAKDGNWYIKQNGKMFRVDPDASGSAMPEKATLNEGGWPQGITPDQFGGGMSEADRQKLYNKGLTKLKVIQQVGVPPLLFDAQKRQARDVFKNVPRGLLDQ